MEPLNMKAYVVASRRNPKEFTVELKQGSQYFRLDYSGSKEEAQWMAKMMRIALKKHSAELPQARPRTRKAKIAPSAFPIAKESA
jgi:hypothetical protein